MEADVVSSTGSDGGDSSSDGSGGSIISVDGRVLLLQRLVASIEAFVVVASIWRDTLGENS